MISNQTCDVVQSVQNQVVEIVCESRKNTSPYMYPFALWVEVFTHMKS